MDFSEVDSPSHLHPFPGSSDGNVTDRKCLEAMDLPEIEQKPENPMAGFRKSTFQKSSGAGLEVQLQLQTRRRVSGSECALQGLLPSFVRRLPFAIISASLLFLFFRRLPSTPSHISNTLCQTLYPHVWMISCPLNSFLVELWKWMH